MFSKRCVLLASTILFILDGQCVSGLRCYDCSSAWGEDCNMSPPPSRYLKPCAAGICSKFYAEEQGTVRIERYCGGSEFANGCRDSSVSDFRASAPRVRAVSCRCSDQDGCNGSRSQIHGNFRISPIIFALLSTKLLVLFRI